MAGELQRKLSDVIIYAISRALSCSEEEPEKSEFLTSSSTDLPVPITSLDDAVILKIFLYLPLKDLLRASAVCKRWYSLSFDQCLWKNVDLRDYSKILTDTNAQLRKVTESHLVSNVVALDLSGFTISHTTLNTLAIFSPGLRKLVLKTVTFQVQGPIVTEVLFPANLHYLDIRYSHGNYQVYKAIARNLTKIKWLGICDGLILSLTEENMLQSTLESLGDLEKLDAAHCKLAKDELVKWLGRCSKLKVLSLRKCINVCGEFLDSLIVKLERLETLILDGTSINDNCLERVSWETSKIRTLELGWCPFISSAGLQMVLPKMSKMNSLQYLGLCCVGEGKALTDENLLQFAVSLSCGACKNLNSVNLSLCDTITDAGLNAFLDRYPKVQTVDASNCAGVLTFCGEQDSVWLPEGRKYSLSDTDIDENNNAIGMTRRGGQSRRRKPSRGSFSTIQFALSNHVLETPL